MKTLNVLLVPKLNTQGMENSSFLKAYYNENIIRTD